MRKNSKAIAGLLLALLTMTTGYALAEMKLCDQTIYGEADIGFRVFLDRPSDDERGKLEEYRDLSNGLYESVRLQLLSGDEDYLMELSAFEATHDDQRYLFRSSMIGLYDLEIEWDQIPHLFTTASPREDEISFRRDSANVDLSFTPTPEWDITTEYSLIDKHGKIPKGLAVGLFPSLSSIREIAMPVDSTQHDAKIMATLARKAYQLQFAYSYSLFDNHEDSILAPGGGGLFDPTFSFAPDNSAHYLTFTGGLNLPYKTRINSTFSYGLRLQTEDFLRGPFDPPSKSDLDGAVGSYLLNLSANSRPIEHLTLRARYRLYHFDDDSDEVFVPDIPMLVERFNYTKHSAALGARWRFQWPLSLDAGFEWERWDRDRDLLEVSRTDEYTPRLSLDYTPLDWLLFKTTYSHSSRIGSDYHPFITATPGQRLLHKFNMADRERDRVDFGADVTPLNSVTVSTHFGLANDDYNDSRFGLQDDDYWAAGADITWRPLKSLSFSAGYLHEEYETRQRSGSEVDIDPGQSLLTQDRIDTVSASMNAILVPEKLTLDLRSSLSYASSDFDNDLISDFRDTLVQNTASLRYDFTSHWSGRLGYLFEVFDMNDSYSQLVGPPSIFLSDVYEDYTAHILILSVGYRF